MLKNSKTTITDKEASPGNFTSELNMAIPLTFILYELNILGLNCY
jgi:hypothetical protein